jgi:ribA/ribD-fused uncharacterized protein
MTGQISWFRDEYEFLSNFSASEIEYEGMLFPTVEHAFQAAKTLDIAERRKIGELATAGAAKRLGRRVRLRSDWEQIKVGLMRDLLRLKFSKADLSERLLATGSAELIEGNNWNDTFWGVCKGRGRNMLGQLLMEIRDEVRLQANRDSLGNT